MTQHDTPYAMSVLGPVAAEQLGTTLMHEHMLFDFSSVRQVPQSPEEEKLSRQPIAIELLGQLRFKPLLLLDNLANADEDLVVDELQPVLSAGGRTVVDPTNASIGRDPIGLQRVAGRAGVNIVMGAGYYTHRSLGTAVADRSVEEIAREIVADVQVGVGDTGVRAGLIGEIGTSSPITDLETKSLRAAAHAQAATGAPLMVHLDGWAREGHAVLDVVEAEGGDLGRVVLCHVNPSWKDMEYQAR
jgi:phosphotriesterase-related protein